MNHLIVTPTALFFAVALVTVAFFISLKEKIGLPQFTIQVQHPDD